MNIYETIVILNPSIGEEDTKAIIGRIADLLKGNGAEILKVEPWGKKKLAYEVKRQKTAYYVFFLYKAPPAAIKRLEDHFKVLDTVLKFMVVKLEKLQIAAIPKELLGVPEVPKDRTQSVEPAKVS